MNEVHPRSYANLQNISLGQRDDALPDLLDGLGISQKAHKMRIDMVPVERHSQLLCRLPHRMAPLLCC